MKNKTKVLPKSQRESKRYFLLDCKDEELRRLKDCYSNLFGLLKLAESNFTIKDEKSKIVKINREFENELIFAINYCNKNNNTKIKIIKKSGTLDSLE